MTKKITDNVDREAGLTLVELLVSLVVGAMVLSALVMVSFNVFHVFDTTKSEALANTDNYSLTTLLHEVAQDATSVSSVSSPQGTSAVQFAMGSIPAVLPTSFKGVTSVTLTWNGSQLLAAATGVTPTVVYSSQNNAAFSLKYDASNLFELVPPTQTSQSIYFHVNTTNPIAASFSKSFSGLTLGTASSQMVPGKTYTLSGNLSTTGGSGSKGIKGVSISISSSAGGSAMTAITDQSGYYSVSYSVPAGASTGLITFTATGDGATATATATIGTYSISALAASPSTVTAGGTATVSGKVLFNQTAVSGEGVVLSVQGGGSLSSSTVTTDANGNFTATYTAPTGPASVTITAADPTLGVTGTVAVSVVMPPSMTLSATPTPVATGQSVTISGQVMINNVGAPNQTITLSDNSAGGSFTSVTIDSSGNYTATYTAPSSASSVTITATDAALNLTKTAQVSVETPVITITASPTTVNSGGKVTITGTVTLGGTGLASQPVTLSDNNAGGSFSSTTVTTDANGNFTATYTAPIGVSSVTLTASALGTSSTVQVSIETPSMTLNATPTPVATGQTVAISGQVLINNAGAPNQTVTLSDNNAGGSFTPVTIDSSGKFTATYTTPSSASSVTITATDAALNLTKTAQVSVETPAITITANPTTVNSGGKVTIKGTVMLGGNVFANQPVTLSDNNAGGSFTPTTVTTDTNGNFTTTYTAATPSLPNVEWLGNSSNPTIVINDVGFGSTPPTDIPAYNTDGNYVGVTDTTGNWNMGMTGNYVAEDILAWSDNQIVVQPTSQTSDQGGGSKHGYGYGYGNGGGNQGWYNQNGWSFNQGDKVQITVQNALGQSITIPTTVNYQSDNVTGTATLTATSDGASASTNLTVNMGYSLPVTQNTLQISNVSWNFHGNSSPVITITGSGFGAQSNWWLIKKDFDGSLVISDTSGSWEMGNWKDPVMENIQSWSDTQITLRPGWGYGKQWWWGGGGANTFNSGDNYTVTLNANGNSTSYTSTVPSHDQNGDGNGDGNGR